MSSNDCSAACGSVLADWYKTWEGSILGVAHPSTQAIQPRPFHSTPAPLVSMAFLLTNFITSSTLTSFAPLDAVPAVRKPTRQSTADSITIRIVDEHEQESTPTLLIPPTSGNILEVSAREARLAALVREQASEIEALQRELANLHDQTRSAVPKARP